MASGGSQLLPTLPVRLRNTVRIQLKDSATEDQKQRFNRTFLIGSILKHLFKFTPEQLYCVQIYPGAGLADVSFNYRKSCQEILAKWEKHAEDRLLGGMSIQALFMQERVPLIVQMYNAYVPDQDIVVFLKRHCKEVWGGTRLRDGFGVWTGQRRFLVQLRPKADAPGEYVHPPGAFSIGPDRGFLSYPGQPVYCRRCGGLGHSKDSCEGLRCRFCGEQGHQANVCPAPKTCSLCGSKDHLFRGCPKRTKTYAEMVAAARRAEEEELAMAAELEREALASEAATDGTELSDSQLLAGASAGQRDELHGAGEEQGPPLVDLTEDAPPGVPLVATDETAGGREPGPAAMQQLLGDIPEPGPLPDISLPLDSASQDEQAKESGLWSDEFDDLDGVNKACNNMGTEKTETLYSSDVEMGVGPRGAKRLAEPSQLGAKQRIIVQATPAGSPDDSGGTTQPGPPPPVAPPPPLESPVLSTMPAQPGGGAAVSTGAGPGQSSNLEVLAQGPDLRPPPGVAPSPDDRELEQRQAQSGGGPEEGASSDCGSQVGLLLRRARPGSAASSVVRQLPTDGKANGSR